MIPPIFCIAIAITTNSQPLIIDHAQDTPFAQQLDCQHLSLDWWICFFGIGPAFRTDTRGKSLCILY